MKILLYDIETSPNIIYAWGTYQQNAIDVKKPWELLSCAYKWFGESEVFCITRQGEKSDKNLAKKIWNLIDKADVIVAHNGKHFDNKKITAKFAEHGFFPPSPYRVVDTKEVAATKFAFPRNGLDALGKHFGLGQKLKHDGFELWLGCMANSAAAWKKMIRYNKQDVVLLEKIYLKLRPYMDSHPNIANINGVHCPKCNSTRLRSHGLRATQSGGCYRRLSCLECGGWCRERQLIGKPTLINS